MRSDVRDGAIARPGRGTRRTTQGPAAGHAGQVIGPAFRFDPNRCTAGDRITGIGTVRLLVSLFLP